MGHLLKPLSTSMIILLPLVILLTTFIWYSLENSDQNLFNTQLRRHHVHNKINDSCKESREKKTKTMDVCSQFWTNENLKKYKTPPEPKLRKSKSCKDCRANMDKILKNYTRPWVKNDTKQLEFRTELRLKCNGLENAIITQENTPLGTNLFYDGQKTQSIKVNSDYFTRFVKRHPVFNKTLDTCAVVGNGGILANSSCGKMIDSAQFVLRCNLAPLVNGFEKHVGLKTELVTANPSILYKRYGSLLGRRRMFAESLCQYGNSMLLLPAFSYVGNTALCLRASNTIEDFEMPIQPVFLNPKYLESLAVFWQSHGLKEKRLSTGVMMVSLALELCENVDLYGFWPFYVHPHSLQDLSHHYYDDQKPESEVHIMPDEFRFLLQLHSQGVLKLHLGECGPNA